MSDKRLQYRHTFCMVWRHSWQTDTYLRLQCSPWTITVTARCKAWTVFARSNAWIVGLNPAQGMNVCVVCVYSVCVVLCVGRGLATGWSTIQGVLPTVYRIKKLKKGCRAINNINNNNYNVDREERRLSFAITQQLLNFARKRDHNTVYHHKWFPQNFGPSAQKKILPIKVYMYSWLRCTLYNFAFTQRVINNWHPTESCPILQLEIMCRDLFQSWVKSSGIYDNAV
jgi:hypothetical protein